MKKALADVFSKKGPKVATKDSGRFDLKKTNDYKKNIFEII